MSSYPPEQKAALLAELESWLRDGRSRAAWIRHRGGTPHKDTLWEWERGDPELRARLQEARSYGAHELIDQAVEVADNRDADPDPASRKCRAWARFEAAKRLAPREYGDRQQVEHSGALTLEQILAESRKPPDAGDAE